jgi:hypothetical protein
MLPGSKGTTLMNEKTPLDTKRTQHIVDDLFNASHAAIRARRPNDGIVAKRRTGLDFRPNPVGDQVITTPVSVAQLEQMQRARAKVQADGYRRLNEERQIYGRFELPPQAH